MKTLTLSVTRIGVAMLCLAAILPARADLFGDDEARRAILDLRQRFDAAETAQNTLVQDSAQTRNSLLELQQQIATLQADLAQLRGQQEQLQRDNELLRGQRDAFEERLHRLESGLMMPSAEGAQGEKGDYDAALALFRSGSFESAQTKFADFVKRYPRSAYAPSAMFWLGNAQYATRNYAEAISNFQALLKAAPDHARAPEAMLSIANCQIEMKNKKAARTTLQSLLKTYPKSEAAQAAQERLANL